MSKKNEDKLPPLVNEPNQAAIDAAQAAALREAAAEKRGEKKS